jgi:mono/diheme cytochrome c family protein
MQLRDVASVLALLTLAACDASSGPKEISPAPRTSTTSASALGRASADRGRKLFAAECAGCHGERGRGDGPAAAKLKVPPRDFTRERFKFRSTDYGEAPTRQDLFDTITHGLGGSGMPAFTFLSESERWDLVETVRGFAGLASAADPRALAVGPETANGPESVARGRKSFETLGCVKCHGPEGRGDGPSAAELKDNLGRAISPRNLTADVLRRGESSAVVHRTVRTGIAGTPMPGFSQMSNDEGWDVVHFVQSMRKGEATPPADPVALGRFVVQQKKCNACHVIEGDGGRVGPSLDVSAQKLRTDWAKRFLKDPRPFGKIYPYIPYRMPNLGLTDAEIDGVLALFAQIAGRQHPESLAAQKKLETAHEGEGKLLFFLRCTECHNFGNLIPTPAAKQQGPDLIHVTERLRPEWISKWLANPKAIYPDTKMVDPKLTAAEVEAVRRFVWNTSFDTVSQGP